MKTNRIFLAFLVVAVMVSSCRKVPKSGKQEFQSSIDSTSYALGYIEAMNIKRELDRYPFEMDSLAKIELAKAFAKTKLSKRYLDFRSEQFDSLHTDAFYKGFLNELAYGKSYFSEMSADIYLRKVFQNIKNRKDSIRKELGKENLMKGEKFLSENKQRKEVVTTESGLQYEIIGKGEGKLPDEKSKVRCVYHGTLINGTVFDSSKERGDTTSFYVNRVVKGWTEALQQMPEGSEWRLYIPSELAYGEKGNGDKIGPNETLIFDLKLIEIVEEK